MDKLPTELLVDIFSLLVRENVYKFACLCHTFYSIYKSPAARRRLLTRRLHLNPRQSLGVLIWELSCIIDLDICKSISRNGAEADGHAYLAVERAPYISFTTRNEIKLWIMQQPSFDMNDVYNLLDDEEETREYLEKTRPWSEETW
jgi:hypothetical protein